MTVDDNLAARFFSFRGFMKSGTNWIASLLNLHPDVHCTGELHFHTLYLTVQRELRFLPIMQDQQVRNVFRGNLQAMFRQVLVELGKPGAFVLGDRTPHTLAPLVIKGAPQITITRDGRDVLVSRLFHLYNYPEVSRVFQRFPRMRETLARFRENPWHFREHPHELLAEKELVQESLRWWREHHESDRQTMARHPGLPVLQLKYEDFHNDVESSRRKMYRFLGVDPARAAEVTPELMPGIPEERPNEFNRKGIVGDWVNYFDERVRNWVNEAAGDELIRQGYVKSRDWQITL